MKLVRYISLLVLVLFASLSYSQSWTGRAFNFYDAKDYDNAKSAIDSAITTYERFDSQTWQLRGLIYGNVSTSDQLYYREIALESFVRAKSLDSTGIYTENINSYLDNTLIRYYNDAVNFLLEEQNFEKSIESYELYKDLYRKLRVAGFEFTTKDINFYNAVGAEFLKKVDLVEPDKKPYFREKALFYCNKVLKIDSLDYMANFNSGIVHYNIGADYVMTAKPETTLEELTMNLKKSEDAFLKAIVPLHRAEKLKPNSLEVQEALMGCYYGLLNNNKYLKYQTLVDKHYIQSYIDQYKADPTDQDNIKKLIRIYTYTLIDEEKADYYKNILFDLKNK